MRPTRVSLQPGTDADSDVNEISNLAMADLRRLPPGTLPPIVQKFDASSLPVCLITLKGDGLTETQLRDLGQFTVRNQLAVVPGASIPPPFGGKYRQIMVYVDPAKLNAYDMSPMDVVRAVNNANLILPSGDVKLGPFDYTIFTNSQFRTIPEINQIPLRAVGQSMVRVGDVGRAQDGHQIQVNIVKVDGQPSVYLPVMKQGGDTNTIAVVDGIKDLIGRLVDVPQQLVASVVFDQSLFVRAAIITALFKGQAGLGNDSPFAPVFPSTNHTVPQRAQDIAKAKSLLSAAGHSSGFTTQLVTEQFVEIPQYAQIVVQAAKQIGVTIKLQVESSSQYYGKATFGNSDWLDATMSLVDYGHRSVPNVFLTAPLQTGGTWNAAHFANSQYDTLVKQYIAATDMSTQKSIAGQIEQLLLNETPIIFGYFYNYLTATAKGVTGVYPTAIGHLFLNNAAKS
jgi:hypothetical protein